LRDGDVDDVDKVEWEADEAVEWEADEAVD
jgi:hypothetical protein